MNPNFQVGDRVCVVRPGAATPELAGMTGRVCAVLNAATTVVGVEHDGTVGYFHNCNGACGDGLGYWYFIPDHQLEKIDSANVQIDTLDGLI